MIKTLFFCKAVVLPQALVMHIDLAERVSAIQLFQLYPILERNCILINYLYSFIVFTCVNSSQRLP